MLPGFSGVGGFVDAVANGKIGPLQAFAAADINDVRVGRRDGQSADRASRLPIEDRRPGASVVGALPDAAIIGRHVEHVGLLRDAGDSYGATGAKRADKPPFHPCGYGLRVHWAAKEKLASSSRGDNEATIVVTPF